MLTYQDNHDNGQEKHGEHDGNGARCTGVVLKGSSVGEVEQPLATAAISALFAHATSLEVTVHLVISTVTYDSSRDWTCVTDFINVAIRAMELALVAIMVGVAKTLSCRVQTQGRSVVVTLTEGTASEAKGSRLAWKTFTSHMVTTLTNRAVALPATIWTERIQWTLTLTLQSLPSWIANALASVRLAPAAILTSAGP